MEQVLSIHSKVSVLFIDFEHHYIAIVTMFNNSTYYYRMLEINSNHEVLLNIHFSPFIEVLEAAKLLLKFISLPFSQTKFNRPN